MTGTEILELGQGRLWAWKRAKQEELALLYGNKGRLFNPSKLPEVVYLTTQLALDHLKNTLVEGGQFLTLPLEYSVRSDGHRYEYSAVLIRKDLVPGRILHPHPGGDVDEPLVMKLTYKLTPKMITKIKKNYGCEYEDYADTHREIIGKALERLESDRSAHWQCVEVDRLAAGEAIGLRQMGIRVSEREYDRLLTWWRSGEAENAFMRRMFAIALDSGRVRV